MPLTSIDSPVNLLDNTTYWQPRVISKEVAQVGYFKTQLKNGIQIETAGSAHAGILQYEFPSGGSHVLVDVSHYLPSETGGYNDQFFIGGDIELLKGGKQYTGSGNYIGGFNEGAPWKIYFCGEFDTPADDAKTFTGPNTDPISHYHSFANGGTSHPKFRGKSSEKSGPMNERIGAIFSWNTARTVKSKIGISHMDVETACKYKDTEIKSWTLQDSVDASVSEWNKDVFSKIQVPTDKSANKTNLNLLYSSLYFMHLMPVDKTGENPLWESDEPAWDDFYTLWDIFRCTVTLYHLIQPARYTSMIRSLIDIWRYDGFMPDGRSGHYNGLVQGGSNADNVLADAYVRGLRDGINWTDGYAAMVKNAEVIPFNTFSPLDQMGSVKEGRGALADWLELGYLSVDRSTRSISRTVEYSLNDFALSVVAKGEAPDDVEKYLNRSASWQRLWNKDVKSQGFTGFMAPRLSSGDFNLTDYNPALCGGCEWDSITYEATPWEYSFTIPHDMTNLIKSMGGTKEFERRMDHIFIPGTSEQDLSANGAGITTLMNIGNEPDFATPYLYHYINHQHKSVNQTRALANQFFHNAPYGVPGNSDAGALNSWLIWSMLGLYPVVTQDTWLIASPWFDDIKVSVNGDKTLHITAKTSGDKNKLGYQGYYVQSVKINGKKWTKNWFTHDELMVKGGEIEFELGSKIVNWDSGDVPPSPGHYTL